MQTNEQTERTVWIARSFDAPRELVFSMWTDERHFSRWCAPARFEIVSSRSDARRNGVWWSTMRAPDGEQCKASGVYREVTPPQRLVFTYAHELPDGTRGPETLVTVTLEETDGKTLLSLQQALFDTVEDRAAHFMGWNECFDKLTDVLETAKTAIREEAS